MINNPIKKSLVTPTEDNPWGLPPGSKFQLNLNCPAIVALPDGSLVQLSPDNYKALLGEKVEIEFFEGPVEPPENVRLIWARAKDASRLLVHTGKLNGPEKQGIEVQ